MKEEGFMQKITVIVDGSFVTSNASYPLFLITSLIFPSGISVSVIITVSFLLWDEVTFFTGNAARTASFTCASHIPHCIPSTFLLFFLEL